jgi:ATP-dependent DNA ligase
VSGRALLSDNAAGGGWFLTAERPRRATVARTERAISKACAYLRRMFKAFEFCIPTRGIKVPSGPDWLHEVKYDGLYEASRVKKFSRKNIFSRSSRRVSAVLH